MNLTFRRGMISHPGRVRAMCVTGVLISGAGSLVASTFTDVTASSGISHVHADLSDPVIGRIMQSNMSGGAVAVDYDQDGWTDLYFTRLGAPDVLYRNLGDGTFTDVTASVFGEAHMADELSNGCGWADIDNDGDQDLYLTSLKTNRYHLWINDGQGGFTEEAVARGAAAQRDDLHYGFSVSFGDYDRDGYLDLHVCEWRSDSQNENPSAPNTRLLRNLGAASPGHFEDVTEAAGVVMNSGITFHTDGALAFTSRFLDLDGDGWQDLMVASDGGTSRLFWNKGDGTFLDGTTSANVGTDEFGMGSTVGDFDGDGDFDWFVTSILMNDVWSEGTGNRLYRNEGGRTFSDATTAAGVRDGGWGWGTSFFDFDNDRDLDLMMVNGLQVYVDQTRLWENDGSGAFTNIAGPTSGVTDGLPATGFLTFDYDRDGDQDAVVVNNGAAPILYRNDQDTGNDWLKLDLTGVRSNRDGIGAEVRITVNSGDSPMLRYVDGGSNFLSQSERLVHIGLGAGGGSAVQMLEILWPSGIRQVLNDVMPNQRLELIEPVDGAVVMKSVTPLNNGGLEIRWQGQTGKLVRVQWSADLKVWLDLAVARDGDTEGALIDARERAAYGFYRAFR